jgi:hypothetical protein
MSYLVKLTTIRESFITFDDEKSAREWAERVERKSGGRGSTLIEVEEHKVSVGNEFIVELEILKTTPVRHVFFGEPEEEEVVETDISKSDQ